MKRIHSIIIILISVLSSILILLHYDKIQQKSFFLLDLGYYNSIISVKNFDKIDFSEEKKYIDRLANETNVKVLVSQYSYQKNTIKTLFSSNADEEIRKILNINQSSLSYSTYGKNATISDILGNDNFIYENLASSLDEDFYWNGEITISHDSEVQYKEFVQEFLAHFSLTKDSIMISTKLYRETGQLLNIVLIFSVFICSILFILAVIHKINSNTSQIGVLLLLGYRKTDIIKKIVNRDFTMIYLGMIISVIGYLLLSNIPRRLLVIVLIKDLSLIGASYLIYYWFLVNILKSNSISSILKKQNVIDKLSNTNAYIQTIIFSFILIISLLSSRAIKDSLINYENRQQYKYLLDYGVIYSMNSAFMMNNDFSKTETLLNDIIKNEILKDKFVYANFEAYLIYKPGTIVHEDYLYDDLYAFVSPNYFALEDITLYDDLGNNIKLDDAYISDDIFIFPKKYDKGVDILLNAYFSNNVSIYANDKNQFKPKVLYYDNQEVHTYLLDLYKIDSPVFKIVRVDEKRNYIGASQGLSLYGVRMNTGLKFAVQNNRKELVNELAMLFSSYGLNDVFSDSNFVVFSDYLNMDLARHQMGLQITLVGTLIITILYIFTQLQFVTLYIVQNYRTISIRRFLGHEPLVIYKEVFMMTVLEFVIALFVAILTNFFLLLGDWIVFSFFVIGLLILSFIITITIVAVSNQDKMLKSLKRG